MQFGSESVEILVEQFSKLPTIGRKSAQRLAAHVIKMPKQEVTKLANALIQVKERVRACSICMNVTDTDICIICKSTKREPNLICVVESPEEIAALERMGEYRGMYHVLGGVISPMDGVGPDDLHILPLIERIRAADSKVNEVILAMSPTVEGDTTAFYLSQLLEPFLIKISRLARGVPVGLTLTYADEATLSRAIAGRETLSEPQKEQAS